MESFSLENILTQEIKVKVIFKHKIDNFGFFISDTFKSIEANVKVDVPLYIAQFLLENDHCVLVNEVLGGDVKNDIRANSSIINLNLLYSYFYYFVINFENRDYIIDIMFSRYNSLFKLILKERLDEDDIFILDASERRILISARKYYQMYRTYFILNN